MEGPRITRALRRGRPRRKEEKLLGGGDLGGPRGLGARAPREGRQAEAWRRHTSRSVGRRRWEADTRGGAAKAGNVGWVRKGGRLKRGSFVRRQGACSEVKGGGRGGQREMS